MIDFSYGCHGNLIGYVNLITASVVSVSIMINQRKILYDIQNHIEVWKILGADETLGADIETRTDGQSKQTWIEVKTIGQFEQTFIEIETAMKPEEDVRNRC